MTSRQLLFHDDARGKIYQGVQALTDAVRVTLGPRGRTVILEPEGGGPPQIVNSGVVVARAIELPDRFANMGAQLLREVSARTSEMAGDGTTTATVLAHGLIQEGLKYLASGMNPMGIKRGIDRGVELVVAQLRQLARPCLTTQEMAHVAALSANNDPALGDLVARAMQQVGREGAISIEDGSGTDSTLHAVEGLQWSRGYLSPYFINEPDRHATVLENVAIALCDQRISAMPDLLPLMQEAAQSSTPLLVIAEDLDNEALATLVINCVRGAIQACAVKAPGFGESRQEWLQDLALVTGGQVLSPKLGQTLSGATLAQLGRAKRIEIDKDKTTVVGGLGPKPAIDQHVAALKARRDKLPPGYERQQLEERIGRLSGGVALIQVGAATETELKERKLRLQDALHATRAAVAEGIVPGAGVALLKARQALQGIRLPDMDQNSGIQTVARALEEPLRRIVTNAGDDPDIVLAQIDRSPEWGFGYNAATREMGNLLAMGVVDPVRVTRLALQNAASIAGLVLTTDCMVAHAPRGLQP